MFSLFIPALTFSPIFSLLLFPAFHCFDFSQLFPSLLFTGLTSFPCFTFSPSPALCCFDLPAFQVFFLLPSFPACQCSDLVLLLVSALTLFHCFSVLWLVAASQVFSCFPLCRPLLLPSLLFTALTFFPGSCCFIFIAFQVPPPSFPCIATSTSFHCFSDLSPPFSSFLCFPLLFILFGFPPFLGVPSSLPYFSASFLL